jgi:hypothetical protein
MALSEDLFLQGCTPSELLLLKKEKENINKLTFDTANRACMKEFNKCPNHPSINGKDKQDIINKCDEFYNACMTYYLDPSKPYTSIENFT